MEEFNNDFLFKNKPDETTPLSAENLNTALKNTRAICSNTAGAHNGIFRGKDITNYFDDDSLWERISSGKFTDLFVGDYIVKNGITWRIAGFDIYLNKGEPALTKHHAVIVPDESLTTSKMNDDSTTEGGYKSSYMYNTTIPDILTNNITPVFSNHILQFHVRVTNSINKTGYNRFGTATGCSNTIEAVTRSTDLMNEVQVFGTIVYSSSGADVDADNVQFPLFRLAPEFIMTTKNYCWLKSIASNDRFCVIGSGGRASTYLASVSYDVRPYFYID